VSAEKIYRGGGSIFSRNLRQNPRGSKVKAKAKAHFMKSNLLTVFQLKFQPLSMFRIIEKHSDVD